MPARHVMVDRVRSLDVPKVQRIPAQASGVPGHVVVHLGGGASLLDLSDPRAAIWEAVLDDLRQANEPVYLETDPNTNVIQEILVPKSVTVAAIAAVPVGVRHEVELEISQARHHIKTSNPEYQRLLTSLTAARTQGTAVLVTETLNDHEIIDVRPDPSPFAGGPAMMVMMPAGPLGNVPSPAGITPQQV